MSMVSVIGPNGNAWEKVVIGAILPKLNESLQKLSALIIILAILGWTIVYRVPRNLISKVIGIGLMIGLRIAINSPGILCGISFSPLSIYGSCSSYIGSILNTDVEDIGNGINKYTLDFHLVKSRNDSEDHMNNILSARFYNALWTASADRDKYQHMIDDDGTNTPAWIKHERSLMLETVNAERAKQNLPPITEGDIKKGEIVGDPNYGKRLADHCADLCKK